MKLNLFFVMMDLLTLMAYPFVFVYSRIQQILKSRKEISQAD